MQRAERFVVYPMLVLLAWAVFGDRLPANPAAAADKDARFNTVRARRIEIVDAKGRGAAVLGTSATGGGALIIQSPEGKPVLELGVRDHAGMVTLMRHEETPQALLQLAADKNGRGRIAILGDAKNVAHVLIGRTADGGQVSVRNAKGGAVASMLSTGGGTGFVGVTNGGGDAKAFLAMTANGGLVGVKDRASKPSVMIHASDKGGVVQLEFEEAGK